MAKHLSEMTFADAVEEIDQMYNDAEEGIKKINKLVDEAKAWFAWFSFESAKHLPSLRTIKFWAISFGIMFALQTFALLVIAIALVL